jgi:hypothetical protein
VKKSEEEKILMKGKGNLEIIKIHLRNIVMF